MMKSMTGYGIDRQVLDGKEITVEIKSVNHRYFDFLCTAPRSFGYLENMMKNFIASSVNRGRVTVYIAINTLENKRNDIVIDKDLARNYIDNMRELKNNLGLEDDLTLSSLLKIKDIFSMKRELPDEDEIWDLVSIIAKIALEKFEKMTSNEGKKLKEDILARVVKLKNQIKIIKEKSPESIEKYRQNLYDKLKEILEDEKIDESRILTETAIFADKIATDEETVRFESHLLQMDNLINSDETVIGRKMDFIVQELNREINTIGSKTQDIEISKIVVDVKSEIEKIREQIQNIV